MTLTTKKIETLMPDVSQFYSDEPEIESSLHSPQLLLLVTCLNWLWQDRSDSFIELLSDSTASVDRGLKEDTP
jgi:hypothetical protein